MKRLEISCALILALIVSMPALAREPSDSPITAVITRFFDSFNSGNVDQTVALWLPDSVDINVNGLVSDKTQLDARIAAELKAGLKFDHTIERVQVVENVAWAAGRYTITIPGKDGSTSKIDGGWLQVLKRHRGTWKIQAASFTRFNSSHPTK